MAIKDRFVALSSRSLENSTRIDSPVSEMGGAMEELTVVDSGTVYKVYKRRWIGVAIIMLLNIVSSWRYPSSLLQPPRNFLRFWAVGFRLLLLLG